MQLGLLFLRVTIWQPRWASAVHLLQNVMFSMMTFFGNLLPLKQPSLFFWQQVARSELDPYALLIVDHAINWVRLIH